ncbi:MAG: oligosaccharide flippase family protein [Thermaurantimonas sp.]|uniref:oligosaccharide flippase family protein n=1 Tax=Thermaurantimonas sp. TaxID=2681568 RepID=UPI00391A2DEE
MIFYFLKNFAFLLLLNVLIKPFWVFFIDIPVQNAVGHDVYGMYFTAFNFAFIFSIFSDMGLNHFNNIHLADKSIQKEFSYASVLPLKLLFSLIYVLIASIFSVIIFDNKKIIFLVFISSIFHALTNLILFLRTYLSSHMQFKNDSFYSIFDKIISTIILGILLYFSYPNTISIETFLYVQIISLLFSVMLLIIILKKHLNFSFRNFSLNTYWFKEALPYTLLIFVMGIYTRIDSTLIQLLTEKRFAGIYAASFRLIDFLSQYGYLSSVILLPLFSSLKVKQTESIRLLQSIIFIMIYTGYAIAFLFMLISTKFIHILYNEDTRTIAEIFQIHLMAYPFIISNFVLGSFLTANRQIRYLIRISVIAAFFQILGNYFLIKLYNVNGASVGMVLTNMFIFFAQFYWIFRKFNLENMIYKKIQMLVVLGLAVSLFFFYNKVGFNVLMVFFLSGGAVWIYTMRKVLSKTVLDKPFFKLK